jgi:hypothetical protein
MGIVKILGLEQRFWLQGKEYTPVATTGAARRKILYPPGAGMVFHHLMMTGDDDGRLPVRPQS